MIAKRSQIHRRAGRRAGFRERFPLEENGLAIRKNEISEFHRSITVYGIGSYPFELESQERLFFSRSLCSVRPTVRQALRVRSSLVMRPSRIVSFKDGLAD